MAWSVLGAVRHSSPVPEASRYAGTLNSNTVTFSTGPAAGVFRQETCFGVVLQGFQ